MNERIFITAFCIFGLFISNATSSKRPQLVNMGPFRVIFKKFSNLSDDFKSTGKVWNQVSITPPPTNNQKQQNLWGVSYNAVEINDNLKVDFRMAARVNHRWKKNAFAVTLDHACSDLVRQSKQLARIHFGDDGLKCPIKPGYRPITNHTIDLVFPEFRTFAYGRWQSTLLIKSPREIVGIYVAEFETVPRT